MDSNVLSCTSTGTQSDIEIYRFDYRSLEGPEISARNMESKNKKVIIAALTANAFDEDMQRACRTG